MFCEVPLIQLWEFLLGLFLSLIPVWHLLSYRKLLCRISALISKLKPGASDPWVCKEVLMFLKNHIPVVYLRRGNLDIQKMRTLKEEQMFYCLHSFRSNCLYRRALFPMLPNLSFLPPFCPKDNVIATIFYWQELILIEPAKWGTWHIVITPSNSYDIIVFSAEDLEAPKGHVTQCLRSCHY